jgi:flagellar M-ring protein FliF
LAAVADRDALPPNFNTILETALGKGGPWESNAQAKERLKIARQATLSEIVRAMPWVENAVVLYDEHDSRDPRNLEKVKQASASVSVKPIVGESLTAPRVKSIQKLVASAVSMKPGEVAVTNLGEGGVYGSDSELTSDIFEDGSLMQTKVAFESQKRESIMKSLQNIPGVRVEVNADFNDTIEQTTRSIKPDKAGVTPSRTTESKQESLQTTTKSAGQPGLVAQGPNRQGASESAQQNNSKTTNTVDEAENVVPVEENRTLRKGYSPKEVWATVTIPSGFIENLWKSKNPTATAAPKQSDLTPVQTDIVTKVENIVEPLLILQVNKGQDQYKHVRVVVLDSLPAPSLEPPSMASTASNWFGHYWNTLAMLGVAMFSLLVLRSVVNGKPGDAGGTPAAAGPVLALQKDEPLAKPESTGEQAEERPKLRLKKGSSLKDDLTDIVRDDPDAAADILRSWIGKAG